ncbi:MAG: hypothetical protein WD029_03735, partial [Microthrixaceae bacterium]
MLGSYLGDRTTHRRLSERALLRRYLVGCVIWGAIFLVLPGSLKPVWYSLFGWTSVVIAGLRARRFPANIKKPALLIVAAGVVALTGGIVRVVDGAVRGSDYPFPSVADAFSFASLILFLSAILMIVQRRVGRLTLDPVLDAIIGGVAIALIEWRLILLPYLQHSSVPHAHKVTNLIYAALSLLLVVAALLALVSGAQRSLSNRLLAAGLVTTFALDLVATLVTAGYLPSDARLYVAPFAFMFGVAGLLHPSVIMLTSPPSDPALQRRLTNKRIGILALALLTPPLLILTELLVGSSEGMALPAVAALALAPLVVTRLGRLVRQNEQLAETEESLRYVGERLVSAESAADIVRIITIGAEQLLNKNFIYAQLLTELHAIPQTVELQTLDEASRQALKDVVATELHFSGELESRLGSDSSTWSFGSVLMSVDHHAALLVHSRRPLGDNERNAVAALCRETALAFQAHDLTEQQVLQRSEERFGALIDNSSDIVLVLQ